MVACAHAPRPDANAPAVIAAQLDRFLAGVSAGDPSVHTWWWADDLVYTSSSGARFGKATILEGSSPSDPPAAPAVTYTAEDVQVRAFARVATLTFRLVAIEQAGAGQTRTDYLNSGTLRRGERGWQVIVWQATRVSGLP